MNLEEFQTRLVSKRFAGEKIQLYVEREEQDKEPTLVSPFGTFRGKESIEDGISAIKSLA